MKRTVLSAAAVALLAGLGSAPAFADSSALSKYPNAADKIKMYFRDNFGQASAMCGPGQIQDISDAQVVNDTPQQVTMRVDYVFSAKELQSGTRCHGTQTSMVTFDKVSDGQIAVAKMAMDKP